MTRKIAVALFVMTAGLTACSSSPPTTAVLHVLTGAVEVASEASDFGAAVDGQELVTGNVVRTATDGRAEIEYADGSLTRVDGATTFTLVSLSGSPTAPTIEASQSAGNTFHRVVNLAESGGRFSVQTPSASATVQGTEFALFVADDGATTLATISDTVTITAATGTAEVSAGLATVVGADGALGAIDPTPAELLQGAWLTFNRVEDGEQAPPPPLPPEAFFEATLDLDFIGINSYPPGAWLLVVIRDADGSELTRRRVMLSEAFGEVRVPVHLTPGQRVEVTYLPTGEMRETTIVPLEVTAADREMNVIAGTATPGALVVVYVEEPDHLVGEYEVTTAPDGTWHVTTTPTVDLLPEHGVSARIADADGDTTLAFPPENR